MREGRGRPRGGAERDWGTSPPALPSPRLLSECLPPASPCRGSALLWLEPQESKGPAGACGAELHPWGTGWQKKSLLSWARPGAQQPLGRVRSVLSSSKDAVSDFCQLPWAQSGSQPCWHPPGRSPGLCPQRWVPRGGVPSRTHLPPRGSLPCPRYPPARTDT